MDMEILVGKTGYGLQKLHALPAACRSIILQRTRAMREASDGPNFRSFKQQVEAKTEIEVEWNKNPAYGRHRIS